MTDTCPTVSILMPAYNCENYIPGSVQAVLSQSYGDFEFIIINDGSTDQTKCRIHEFLDHRIRYYENEKNCGLVAVLNGGLKHCHGKYIFRTDADDLILPDLLRSLVDFMESNPEYVACGANATIRYPDREVEMRYPSENDDLTIYALGSCPSASSTIFRRQVILDQQLQYRDYFYPGEDHGFWSELIPHGKIHNLEGVLSIYNKSNSNAITYQQSYKTGYPVARKKIFSSQAARYFDLSAAEAEWYTRLHASSDSFLQVILPASVSSMAALCHIEKVILKIILNNDRRGIFEKKNLKWFLVLKWKYVCNRAPSFYGIKMFLYWRCLRRIKAA